jgi:hypothetical protein
VVRTDSPDGALHDYEIKYTFGVYPLQQYLDPDAGRTLAGARDCLGQPPTRTRRPGSFCTRPENLACESVALDQHRPDLELHVRGLPFDQIA